MPDVPAPHERRPRIPSRTPPEDEQGSKTPKRRAPRPGFLAIVVILLGLNWLLLQVLAPPVERPAVPYSPYFLNQVKEGNVTRISPQGETITGEFKSAVRYPNDQATPAKNFTTEIPAFVNGDQLEATLQNHNVVIDAKPIGDGRGTLLSILLGFGPVLLLVGLFVYMARRAGGGALTGLGAFARSRARRVDAAEQRVTFKDVAGIDESKQELLEVVDFLKNPDRYQRLGGRIPRGVLLAGQPGTGKTLLARAVAGEASVPFFSSSASEFVEAIVGVGAARVRDLFKQAKEAAPAIIFIDELDAVGRARSGGAGFGSGSNDEREQTLNQILTEMDGFESDATVIVLGATNRPEVLDSALLRPGRFDRRVTVPAPDLDGRRRILEVHTRSVPLDPDVDLSRIAAITPGMVGADIANLCNEAALLAARREHEKVKHEDFTDSLEKIVLGAPRKMLMSEEDRRRTAYHEAGHAVVGMFTPGADPVRKVSIIPRGRALGVTFSSPDNDRISYDRQALEARIDVALGGRVAEEVVLHTITTGAESDIEQVTGIARSMVGRWGMSEEIGFVVALPQDNNPFIPDGPSDETRRLLDVSVKRLVDVSHERVTHLLSQHRDALDGLAHALLEKETVDQDEAYAAAGVPVPASTMLSARKPDDAVPELEPARE
ncbi:MAG: cell division protease FtsH [Solirubrobacteraceae bacterium]|jgi:cell division protease FtsH|nr:cell division protease FtsH [Solirubrobacteraceae bacterium]